MSPSVTAGGISASEFQTTIFKLSRLQPLSFHHHQQRRQRMPKWHPLSSKGMFFFFFLYLFMTNVNATKGHDYKPKKKSPNGAFTRAVWASGMFFFSFFI
jgi:hypothetical protein